MPADPTNTQLPPLVPHLVVHPALEAIKFYERAFRAEVQGEVVKTPESLVMHAIMRFPNGGVIYLMSPHAETLSAEPGKVREGTKVVIHLELPDVDTTWAEALAAGAKVVMPLADQFWGARYGMIDDTFGHRWSLSTTKNALR